MRSKSEQMNLERSSPMNCGLVYDEKRGMLIAVCNKNGKVSFLKKRVEEL